MQRVLNRLFKDENEFPTAGADYVYAGFWVRLWARILDSLIVLPFIVVYAVIIIILPGISFGDKLFLNVTTYGFTVWLIGTVYNTLLIWLWGTTPGKRLMKLKVIGTDGNRLSAFAAVYRETIGRFLCSKTFFLGYLPTVFTREKLSAADFLADSRVVYSFNISTRPEISYNIEELPERPPETPSAEIPSFQ